MENKKLTEEEELKFMKWFNEIYSINKVPTTEDYDNVIKNIQLETNKNKEKREIEAKMNSVIQELKNKITPKFT